MTVQPGGPSSANSPGLGRSPDQVVAVLDTLAKAGVSFVAIKEDLSVEGKRATSRPRS